MANNNLGASAKYTLDDIRKMLDREYTIVVTDAELSSKLEKPDFIPDIDRMIAVSESSATLAGSQRYGLFTGMTEKGLYTIASGRWAFARFLTPDEIAKCY